jgi:hypothetical protein
MVPQVMTAKGVIISGPIFFDSKPPGSSAARKVKK